MKFTSCFSVLKFAQMVIVSNLCESYFLLFAIVNMLQFVIIIILGGTSTQVGPADSDYLLLVTPFYAI
jgi:hypothetical protein